MQPLTAPFHVIGIAGSLRTRSFNRGLLRAAKDVASIPFYNADVEAQGDPVPVARLKSAGAQADALLIAVAEYDYGVSGVLKNTIDWLSRPPECCVLHGKPAALMGASPGMAGTTRAQLQLRQTFIYTQTPVMPPPPEVLVAYAQEKFDSEGQLTDEDTRARIPQAAGGARNLDAMRPATPRASARMNTLLTWRLALFASFLIAREPVALRISWTGRRRSGASRDIRRTYNETCS